MTPLHGHHWGSFATNFRDIEFLAGYLLAPKTISCDACQRPYGWEPSAGFQFEPLDPEALWITVEDLEKKGAHIVKAVKKQQQVEARRALPDHVTRLATRLPSNTEMHFVESRRESRQRASYDPSGSRSRRAMGCCAGCCLV